MFVAVVDIQLKKGMEAEFKQWVNESNKDLAKFDGFVNRRLLATRMGKHTILVEFESQEKFEKMHQTQEHSRIQSKGHSYMETPPRPVFYEVIAN
ncbi:MAG: antibiotic biosynthesis monooxygenase [Thaumarchaeota archaeon]|nr:antibiotic biosynthesis monooxygenase [Nitrososphaerota archaeon]